MAVAFIYIRSAPNMQHPVIANPVVNGLAALVEETLQNVA
jgi:hypothetical protein